MVILREKRITRTSIGYEFRMPNGDGRYIYDLKKYDGDTDAILTETVVLTDNELREMVSYYGPEKFCEKYGIFGMTPVKSENPFGI